MVAPSNTRTEIKTTPNNENTRGIFTSQTGWARTMTKEICHLQHSEQTAKELFEHPLNPKPLNNLYMVVSHNEGTPN